MTARASGVHSRFCLGEVSSFGLTVISSTPDDGGEGVGGLLCREGFFAFTFFWGAATLTFDGGDVCGLTGSFALDPRRSCGSVCCDCRAASGGIGASVADGVSATAGFFGVVREKAGIVTVVPGRLPVCFWWLLFVKSKKRR